MKLPLSTTYVTFMVAMGSSLADHAWGRESAVFRITGVMSVIGGWFITAGLAFTACGLVALIMYFGSYIAMFGFMILALYLLYRSNVGNKSESSEAEAEKAAIQLMLKTTDRSQTWSLLCQHFVDKQTEIVTLMDEDYKLLVNSMANNDLASLRKINKSLRNAKRSHKRNRRLETLAMRRAPMEAAIERNTWFHIAHNSNQQYIYCLMRMLEPVLEHVDNGFTPMPSAYINEYDQVMQRVDILLKNSFMMMKTGVYSEYHPTMEIADTLKGELSTLRKQHIDRIQKEESLNLTTSQIYLNLLQETQELLSIMRHQLRATKRFTQQT
ncbi:MAG: inorganic phosphate transporter, partial [Bacteroidaceae bacterium]|nr:inorganic phosphate transporter [Bacteroidaceae bacterium]